MDRGKVWYGIYLRSDRIVQVQYSQSSAVLSAGTDWLGFSLARLPGGDKTRTESERPLVTLATGDWRLAGWLADWLAD